MIITTSKSFTIEEIEKLQEQHGAYIKAVIDLEKKLCSAGANVHRESYDILLQSGSEHANTWGGGVRLDSKEVTFHSMINVRPAEGNESNEIEDTVIREKFTQLMKYFFAVVL